MSKKGNEADGKPCTIDSVQLLALFDLDNTLIDRQGSLEEWAREFCESRVLPVQAEHVIVEALHARAYPADLARLRAVLSLADPVESLWSEYVSGMSARARCLPGLPGALARMRASGWTLGVVTNGAVDIQRAKLEGAGLADLFDGVCASGEVGVRKPDLAVFQAAAERCGTTLAKGGWMVGDNPETDIEGGRAAGLRTAWISAGRQWPTGARSPDLEARTASEAIGLLLEQTAAYSSGAV
ncbi:HAD family hydrolase [Streptomyces sp. NBC_01264]|uniref:HAD family hydrolase n=1 Tax=Streptomyces sp. NBC_01264 TaxID=2903804 RepID=UPI00224FDC97|nr:HAD family hydrolase [Streptomyces sp. NBC_01264]MCX4778699.1 HAD family hydrolase [Streptomyces sp. NBC_01264]